MPATPKAVRPDTLNILLRERYATMKLRLGMSPISWSNDDLPQLGGDTPLEVCLSETREAGFVGTETGGKFPKQADALAGVLADHDLALVSGWYSGALINNDLESELDRIADRLDVLGGVIRNLDVEFLFESHDQFDVVEAVGAQVVDEAGLLGDLLRIGVEVFDDDLAHAFQNVGHSLLVPLISTDASATGDGLSTAGGVGFEASAGARKARAGSIGVGRSMFLSG